MKADYYFLAQVCCFTGCPKPKHLMNSLQPPWTPLSFAPHVSLLILTHVPFHTAGHGLNLYLILPTPCLLSMHCTKLFNTSISDVVFYLAKRSLNRKKKKKKSEIQKTNSTLLSNYIHSFVLSLLTLCNIA